MAVRTQATLIAVFRNATSANDAVDELKASGFPARDIYVSSEEPAPVGIVTEQRRQGGFIGWIKSIFGKNRPEEEVRYEDLMKGGNVLVGVDAREEDVDRVVEILNNHSPAELHGPEAEYTGTRLETGTVPTGAAGAQSIPVTEEELKVGKRAVLRGGVRVYSRTVEEPVEQEVNLQEEHVRVERQPANRPATESDFRTGDERTIEVSEYAEEPVVSKEARVVEDIRVGKDQTQRTEKIRDTLRHTEVDVENMNESGEPGSRKPRTERP